MAAVKVTAFPYQELPKFSRNQSLLINSLVRGIDHKKTNRIKKFIHEALFRWFPQGLILNHIELDVPEQSSELETLTGFVGVDLTQAETQSSIYLFLEKQAALGLSHVLLGQAKTDSIEQKLTPLIVGVFEYLVLSLIKEWNKSVPYLTLRFSKVLAEEDDGWLGLNPQSLVRLKFSFELNGAIQAGVVLIPVKMFDWLAENSNQENEEDRLNKFGHLRTLAWAEVGSVNLSPSEVEGLRRGDVILLDETITQFDGAKLSGPIQVSIGAGRGVFVGCIVDTPDLQIKVEQFYVKENL